ncbi:hypothetical protein V6Z92_009260 [Aspergillus fumigatus]
MFHPTQLPHIRAFIKDKLDKAPLDEDGKVPNTDPADNNAGVFLSHAEVYRLAYTVHLRTSALSNRRSEDETDNQVSCLESKGWVGAETGLAHNYPFTQ